MLERKPKAKQNNSTLQIRIPLELRDRLNKLCMEKNINSSELVRQLIIQWCMDQDPNRPHRRQTDLDNL